MSTRARATSRAVLAGCAALAIGTTLSPAPATAGTPAAPGPSEVRVIAPDDPTTSPTDDVLVAGTSGFLHLRQGATTPVWTDYATGTDRTLPALGGSVLPAGGDAFFVKDATARAIDVGTPGRDSLTTYPVPDGFAVRSVAENGTRALAFTPLTSSGPARLEVLDLAADGGVTPVPVTGLPAGALVSASAETGRTDGAHHGLVQYQLGAGGATRYSLVDLDTGATAPVPGLAGSVQTLLTPSDVAWVVRSNGSTVVSMLPQSAVLDGSAAAMTPATVTIPGLATSTFVPVGNHLLSVQAQALGVSTPNPLLDHPFGGGSATTVLGAGTDAPLSASDGSVLAVGGADATGLGVHRYTTAADGTLAGATVLDLPPLPSRNAGLSLAHGFLRHIESIPASGALREHLALYNVPIAPGRTDSGSVSPAGSAVPASLPATALPCETGATCVRTVDGNWSGTSFLMAGDSGKSQIRSEIDGSTNSTTVPLPFTGGRIVDASLDYQVAESATTQYVIQTGYHQILASGPVTGAALWDTTLWQASTTGAAGTVSAYDLAVSPTKAVRTVPIGVACRPTELQVSQHWLYWSCGTSGHAGVYDLASGRKTAVPAGRALLGDGYLVRHDTGTNRLTLTDFHSGTAAAPQTLADLPGSGLTDDRGITFAVDRYGPDLAYVAADRTVHVWAPGVPSSALTASAPGGEQEVDPRSTGTRAFNAAIALDRPVDSWQLTIADAATGTTAAVFTGGPTLETVTAQWTGRLPGGALAQSGTYRWKLTATAGGSSSTVQGASGTVLVMCGALRFRSHGCNGQPDMLGIKHTVNGYEGHWWGTTPSGALVDAGYSEDWNPGTGPGQTSALVPFGDINGDDHGDLLARDPSGVLTAYLGQGEPYFNTQEPSVKRVRIGGGWNIYNTLLSTGDLNGDGHDDLVARDSAGVLWFYAGTDASSLRSRVRIGGGWQSYTRLVATGDITGDGVGDLVAVDGSGVMWRYSGNKHGGFTTRVRIGAGWTMYNTVIGFGDQNHDGHNDLVARDSAGRLWRYNGTASGTFSGARVQIGYGFNSYLALY